MTVTDQPKMHGRDFAANTTRSAQATPTPSTPPAPIEQIDNRISGALVWSILSAAGFGFGALIIYFVSGVVYEFMNWLEGLPL